MTQLTGRARARYVQRMFGRIAGRYDLMNRLMTGGQDVRWRKQVVQLAALPAAGRLLDLGTGTGDIAAEALQRDPGLKAVAADFTLEMMRVGRDRLKRTRLRWAGVDALNLPFPDRTFDGVTSGFLMRNVIDVARALREQFRVLKPGGRMVCLDTTPPPRNWLRPFIGLHLHYVIPTLGRLVTGSGEAYTYLPDSTEGFLQAEALADCMRDAGFADIGFERLMFGTVAIHVGRRNP
jgi:demethylmenaquinone methyltransferase / 2-methoxy-6-polyprenyl-1,4-benzoquinol methylase